MNNNTTVRDKNPLVHCITNYVTVNDVANAILAVGASPIMSDDVDEVAEIISIANALVINIGTLNARTIDSMKIAGHIANAKNVPVILDPVGAGVSKLRNDTVTRLLSDVKFAAIRGNLSEIGFCAGENSSARGVDSNDADKILSPVNVAKIVAAKYSCIAIVTGAQDIVTDGRSVAYINNGVAAMGRITGTGCMLSGVVGAYLGACNDKFSAAVSAVASMGIAGEIAFEKYGNFGTGSLRVGIIDALSKIDDATISQKGNIRIEEVD